MTLTELLVVVAIMAVLMAIAVPAVKGLMDSFDSGTSVRQLISAALSSARTVAIREQKYAGIRFQQDAQGDTYMISIIHDPDASPDGTGLAYGFRAVDGRKPMKLPNDVGLISGAADSDGELLGQAPWRNSTTFSVVFSASGKLVSHPVRVRNRNGFHDGHSNLSTDMIFNIKSLVDEPNQKAMFYQDDYPNPAISGSEDLGLQEEQSVQSFILYSRKDVPANNDTLWSSYFSKKSVDFISPYTGELMIEYRNAQNP